MYMYIYIYVYVCVYICEKRLSPMGEAFVCFKVSKEQECAVRKLDAFTSVSLSCLGALVSVWKNCCFGHVIIPTYHFPEKSLNILKILKPSKTLKALTTLTTLKNFKIIKILKL